MYFKTNIPTAIILMVLCFSCELTNEEVNPPSTPESTLDLSSEANPNLKGNALKLVYKASNSDDIYQAQIVPAIDDKDDLICLEKQVTVGASLPQSRHSPSPVMFRDQTYLIYKAGGDDDLYYAYFDGKEWHGDNRIEVGSKAPQTSSTPIAVVFQDRLYVIYKSGGGNAMYYAYFDGNNWHGNHKITVGSKTPQTSRGPSATVYQDKLHLVYRAGGSSNMYHVSFDGSDWSGDKRVKIGDLSPKTSETPALAVYQDKLYMIYKSAGNDNLYHAYFDGKWNTERKITVGTKTPQTSSAPTAAVLKDKLYIAYRAGGSNYIYYASFNGTSWSGNHRIFGIRTGSHPSFLPSPTTKDQFITNMMNGSPNSSTLNFRSRNKYPYLASFGKNPHIQGIQSFIAGDDQSYYVFSSSNFDSGTHEGLLIITSHESNADDHMERVIKVNGLGHAGGIQVQGTSLVVALAKESSPLPGSKKELRFYDLADPSAPRQTGNAIDVSEFRDAQAAGFVETDSNKRLVFFLTGSSAGIRYNTVALNNENNWELTHPSWRRLDIASRFWAQNINLFHHEGDQYYLIGMRNNDIGQIERDALDLFSFSLDSEKTVQAFHHEGTMYVRGGNMRSAGGVRIDAAGSVMISSFGKEIVAGSNTILTY